MKRATLLAIIAGALFFGFGLIVLVSTLGNPDSTDARAGSLLIMAFGAMIVAVPMYIDARRLVSEHKEAKQAAVRKGSRCIQCGEESATFYCTNHSIGLCLNCLPVHHNPNLCLYRPIVQQLASAQSASATPIRSR